MCSSDLALAALQQAGRLEVQLDSQVERIGADEVLLRRADGLTRSLDNQAVIVCAGGVLPTPLLKDIGIHFETHHGRA